MSKEQQLQDLCLANNLCISLAESCTGGEIAARITKIPGASKYFNGGIVCYTPEAKISTLNVSADLIKTRGVVSKEVAKMMATNSLAVFDSDLALAITGVAGPTGGTDDCPVGTVYISVKTKTKIIDEHKVFSGTRLQVITKAADYCLDLLIANIKLFD